MISGGYDWRIYICAGEKFVVRRWGDLEEGDWWIGGRGFGIFNLIFYRHSPQKFFQLSKCRSGRLALHALPNRGPVTERSGACPIRKLDHPQELDFESRDVAGALYFRDDFAKVWLSKRIR